MGFRRAAVAYSTQIPIPRRRSLCLSPTHLLKWVRDKIALGLDSYECRGTERTLMRNEPDIMEDLYLLMLLNKVHSWEHGVRQKQVDHADYMQSLFNPFFPPERLRYYSKPY